MDYTCTTDNHDLMCINDMDPVPEDETHLDAHDEDDKPMTEAEARAHFEAMGVEIVDNITIIS